MTYPLLSKKAIKYTLLFGFTLLIMSFGYKKNKDYNTLKDVLTQDKQDLQVELSAIVADYKQVRIKNKKLSKRITNEINKIIALKKSVINLEAENYQLIRSYRQKTVRLQQENRMLIAKIDSLNTINTNLKQENFIVNEKLDEKNVLTSKFKKKNSRLKKINTELEKKISPAKQLKISPIKAIAMKEKNSGKLATTSKHNRTDAIKINFKLLENPFSAPGYKKIHIQLKDQENNVIAAKSKSLILKNNQEIKYSDELIVDYKNEALEILSLIPVDRAYMEKGEYEVVVYIDAAFRSSSLVTLR